MEGYCFKIWQANGNKTWYGKSDASGRVYRTDSGYNQAGTKSYTFSGLLDGEFSFREAISQSSRQDSHPVSWRFVVTDKNGKVTVDKTLEESQLIRDGADFLTPRVTLTGLTGGGKLTMTIHNAPNTAPLEILKTSDDGKVSGISFLVEQRIPGSGYQPLGTYTTDGSGRILIPNLSVGVSFRVAETVPQNYTAEKKTQVIMHPRTLKEEPFKAKPPHEPATKCAVLQLIHVGLCVGVCWETHSATWIRCTMRKRTKREI